MVRTSGVPAVDPQQLRQVLTMVYDFVSEDNSSDFLARIDLHELLDHIASVLKVEPAAAIALFKRAVALAAFCASETVADNLLEDGIPGRTLCAAAAKASVLNDSGTEDGVVSHELDAEEMQRALKNSSN